MQEMTITPSTLALLSIILALAALAVRRLVKRGACDCHDHCDGCHGASGGCGCGAADAMVRAMEAAAKDGARRS